jgi:hypothetical protein
MKQLCMLLEPNGGTPGKYFKRNGKCEVERSI